MTADLLQKAVKKVLEEMQKKPSQRTLHQGKQTLHQLKQHGASLTNIEITEQNIKAFSVVAKKERVKTAKQVRKRKLPCEVPKVIRERYGASKQLRYVAGHAVVPVGYIRHKPPKSMNRKINSYTPEGRAEIHKNLDRIDMTVLHYLMRNPVLYRSIEYNDNRLSLYSAQMGKCAVSGKVLSIGDIHCHHKVPRHLGGKDNYQNLVLVCEDVHHLIHATNPDTIRKYMEILNLDQKQKEKLNKLRSLVHVESY